MVIRDLSQKKLLAPALGCLNSFARHRQIYQESDNDIFKTEPLQQVLCDALRSQGHSMGQAARSQYGSLEEVVGQNDIHYHSKLFKVVQSRPLCSVWICCFVVSAMFLHRFWLNRLCCDLFLRVAADDAQDPKRRRHGYD